ncbi:MAG: T9SS type A sorting domain-containing protein [Flavobacteriales bacterium]|nr:T9SS type A sorting domain-containing protein [Flavobacteriales bacterium]
MRTCKLFLVAVLWTASWAVLAQGVSLTPLTARPVPEAVRAMQKANGLNEHFIYQYAPQSIPLVDDFSIDRTRKRWAQGDDPNVSLTETIYRLEVAGVSTPDMVFSADTTFLYMTDTAGVDTTTRTALPEVTVVVRAVTTYPVAEETVQAWPAYNVFDTIQSPSPDTIDLVSPDLVQDSMLVYTVAQDPRTYVNPDNSVVPLVLWQDDDVYINGTYPVDPPTIGVATFDGLSRTGYPYNFGSYTAHGIADHLTTVDIDLSTYAPEDSLYLSFFYQPQGLSGDNSAQPIDSLVLEFWSPVAQFWYHAWSTPYVPLQPFQQILVPVKDPLFFGPDFKFRFLNYATLSGSFDHWHLDYVRMGAQRTFDDTRLIDVAYMYPESSLLQTYTSVPFHKFQEAPGSYMAQSITAQQQNLDNVDRFITYGMLAKEENGGPPFNFNNGNNTSGNASLIFPSDHAINSTPNDFVYDPTLSTDAAFWRVKLWTNCTPDINRYNDTVTFIQEISNYMSYDDGSAELSVGLNTNGSALAYRFDVVGGDSLRAVRMYFNPQANDPQSSPNPLQGTFLVTVWNSLTPENIIWQNFSFSAPEYRLDGIDHFVEYPLDSTIWVEGTFYVGWVQPNNVRMNLGFDRNRNNQNKIFYRTTTTFQPFPVEGSLMMRPVFVAATDPFAGIDDGGSASSPRQLTLVPNPANDAVLVRCDDAMPGSIVQCLDATGRLVKQESWMANRAMEIGHLNPGMYIVRLVDREGNPLAQERLLIQR